MRDFVKSHLDPDADVPSSVNLLSRTLSATTESAESTESTAEPTESTSEEVVEDIVEVTESAAEVRTGLASYSGMSEFVIFCPFVGIAQYGICLGCLLEFLLGLLVARVLVRVVLYSFLPVCFFYFVEACVSVHAKHLVVISFFCHVLFLLMTSHVRLRAWLYQMATTTFANLMTFPFRVYPVWTTS